MNLAEHPPPLQPGELRGQRGHRGAQIPVLLSHPGQSPGGPKGQIFRTAAGQAAAAPQGECFSPKNGIYPAGSSSSSSERDAGSAGGNLCCSICSQSGRLGFNSGFVGILGSSTDERMPGADGDEVEPWPGHRLRGNQPFHGCSRGTLQLILAVAPRLLSCPCDPSSSQQPHSQAGHGVLLRGQRPAEGGEHSRLGSLLPDPWVTREKPPRGAERGLGRELTLVLGLWGKPPWFLGLSSRWSQGGRTA